MRDCRTARRHFCRGGYIVAGIGLRARVRRLAVRGPLAAPAPANPNPRTREPRPAAYHSPHDETGASAPSGRHFGARWCLRHVRPRSDRQMTVVERKAERRVERSVGGKPFTSYIYPQSLEKPVLYPIRSASGTLVTRGYPLEPRPGEAADHHITSGIGSTTATSTASTSGATLPRLLRRTSRRWASSSTR